MATPETEFDLNHFEILDQPSLTFLKDPDSMRLTGTTEGLQAVKQSVEAMLNIERFQWQIYTPYYGISWDGLIGEDPGYVASELQRRVKDALSVDSRILGVSDFSYTYDGENL